MLQIGSKAPAAWEIPNAKAHRRVKVAAAGRDQRSVANQMEVRGLDDGTIGIA